MNQPSPQPAPPTKKEVIIVVSVTVATLIMVVMMFGAQIQAKVSNVLGVGNEAPLHPAVSP